MIKFSFLKMLVMFLALSLTLLPVKADTLDYKNGQLVIDFKSLTPLMFAICTDNKKVVEDLLAADYDPNEASHDGYTPLMAAAAKGNREMVNMLLNTKADLHARSLKGETALMAAACFGSTDIAKMLLTAGADVNARTNSDGVNSLILAAFAGNTEIVEMLLAAGADVNVSCYISGQTALMMAAFYGHTAIVNMLLAAGADLQATNGLGFNALVQALVAGRRDIAKTLYQANTGLLSRLEQLRQKIEQAQQAVVVTAKKVGDDLADGVASALGVLTGENHKSVVKPAVVVAAVDQVSA